VTRNQLLAAIHAKHLELQVAALVQEEAPAEDAVLPVLRAAMENVAAMLARDRNAMYTNLRKF
jgi:hypothetical protein